MPYQSLWSDLTGTAFSQGFLDAGGIRTRYLASGPPDGPLLLLLHGTGGHAESYIRNLAALGAHFRTVAIDFMGHGWSDKPAGSYEIADYAAHVIAVIRAHGRERAMLSGESVGGWVTSHLAIHHPRYVERIVLNCTGGWAAHADVMARLKNQYLAAISAPTPEYIRSRLEAMVFDKSIIPEDMVEARRRIYADPAFAAVMPRLLCLREMDVRQRNLLTESQYNTITAPTLVLWTSNHATYSVAEGRQIASMIPGAVFAVMDHCAQWPQFENPDLFNRHHIAFLKGAPLET